MLRFYVHGGHDIREGSQDTLWELDLGALHEFEQKKDTSLDIQYPEWKHVDTTGNPGPVSRHSMVVYGDRIF
jgi:hypothetical protein